MKYNVGDVVLLKAKVTEIDENDGLFRLEVDDVSMGWAEDKNILALVERNDPEPKSHPKFRIGDKVINRETPQWGVGTVDRITVQNGYPSGQKIYVFGIVYPFCDYIENYCDSDGDNLLPAGI